MSHQSATHTLVHLYGGTISGESKLMPATENQPNYASVNLTFGNAQLTIFPKGGVAAELAAALIEAGEQLALAASEMALNAESSIVALSD